MNKHLIERYYTLTQVKTFKTEAECDAVIATIAKWQDVIIEKRKLDNGEYAIAVNGMLLSNYVLEKMWSLLMDSTEESFDFDSSIAHKMNDTTFWFENPYKVIAASVIEPTAEEIAADNEAWLEEKRMNEI